MNSCAKKKAYHEVHRNLRALLDGVVDSITALATCSAVIHEALPYSSWTGFYRVVAPRLLRIGPYQGPVGCLEIRFGQGVCGVAADSGTSQLVADVHEFPGHIACDEKARSEIVVPVFDPAGNLVAVLDLDSHQSAAFDPIDQEELETVTRELSQHLNPRT